jgi:hypothetical protein
MKRVDIRAILRDSDKRRRMMVGALIAIQAREGRDLTQAQAEDVYDRIRRERKHENNQA